MGTGDKFIIPSNKQILGWDDIATNMIQYCRGTLRDGILAKWKVSGTLGVMNVVAAGANTLQVSTTERATDGDGHIMYPAGSTYGSGTFVFENTNTTTYYVAIGHVDVPTEIRVNPKTGAPQYAVWQEEIGKSADPTWVTDEGNGTITFSLDDVADYGCSYAGRKAMVFKKTPAAGATTTAIAVEVCTIFYASNRNYITTSGSLGQSTISTTLADYTVVLLGPYVTKEDIAPAPADLHMATLAKVVGVGAGNTPTSIDTSIQRVLISYSTARAIEWEGYDWLTAGSVDSAFRTIVDSLKSTAWGSSGTSRIGFDPSSFANRVSAPDNEYPGMGNVTDGTYTSSSNMQDLLGRLDLVLGSLRTASATISPDGWTDLNNLDTTADWDSGLFVVRGQAGDSFEFHSHDNDGISKYECERVTSSQRGAFLVPSSNDGNNVHGHWSRFDFGYSNVTLTRYWNFWSQYMSNIELDNCHLESCHVQFGLGTEPTRTKDCIVSQSTGHLTALTSGVIVSNSATDHIASPMGIFEGSIFTGPNTSTASPHSCLRINALTSGSSVDHRPIVFRDCVFISGNTSITGATVWIETNTKVVFENCSFIGIAGQTVPVVYVRKTAARANVIMKNCHIYAPSGVAVDWADCGGRMDGCTIVSGTDTTVTQPQLFSAYGSETEMLYLQNNYIYIDTGAIRTTGINGSTYPAVEIGSRRRQYAGKNSLTSVNGLNIRYIGGTALHNSQTLFISESYTTNFKPAMHYNITVDLAGLGVSDSASAFDGLGNNSIVKVGNNVSSTETSNTITVDGLSVIRIGCGSAAVNGTVSVVSLESATAKNVLMTFTISGSSYWQTLLLLNGSATVIGGSLRYISGNTIRYYYGAICFSGSYNILERFKIDLATYFSPWDASMAPIYAVGGTYNQFNRSVIIGYVNATATWSLVLFTGTGHRVEGNVLKTSGASGARVCQFEVDRGHFINNQMIHQSGSGSIHCVDIAGNYSVVTGNVAYNLTSDLTKGYHDQGTGNQVANNVSASA